MDWIKIKINIHPENLETVSPGLFNLGAEGVEEKDNRIIVYFKHGNWNPEINKKLSELLKRELPELGNIELNAAEIPTEAWNEKWKENFKPFKISEDLMIYPDWEPLPFTKDIDIIVISPKMAFGTGHHETTRLILEIIPQYLQEHLNVLDAGTGSGILAIYSIIKGAAHVTAYDFDPLATENTVENIRLNHVEDKISVITGELDDVPKKNYDLILANINKNILIDISGKLHEYIMNNGILILSGLLREDYEQIISVYNKNWQLIDHKAKNEWIALVFKPKDKNN